MSIMVTELFIGLIYIWQLLKNMLYEINLSFYRDPIQQSFSNQIYLINFTDDSFAYLYDWKGQNAWEIFVMFKAYLKSSPQSLLQSSSSHPLPSLLPPPSLLSFLLLFFFFSEVVICWSVVTLAVSKLRK